MSKLARLAKLNKRMSRCSKCTLRCGASRIVPGAGNPDAEIIFIGEAPGKKEYELGVPFVGSSGKILDKLLESINLKREEIFLTNILKCRPPKNRDPLPEEITICIPWLEKQIEIIDPEIVVTLGRHALNCFIPNEKISDLHGEIINSNIGKLKNIKIFPLHHPAAARQNKITRKIFEQDFQKIPAILKQVKKEQ